MKSAVSWSAYGAAQLLPRLIGRRTRGPLFFTNCKAPAGTPTLDVCPETGRARLFYRRAEEFFEENTRLLANPLASPEDIEDLDGWTLHRLRHSALTHDAEDGTSTPMLLARSRHASVRSLERYARPGVDSVARHVAERDPAAPASQVSPSASGLQDHPVARLTRILVTPHHAPRLAQHVKRAVGRNERRGHRLGLLRRDRAWTIVSAITGGSAYDSRIHPGWEPTVFTRASAMFRHRCQVSATFIACGVPVLASSA
ncbi:hypothetical protein [Streptomyces cyaneofuscatus]|uniref:hypothetical protein n=1 Tax=Streptomyces cyaneofuscatus TaxID=66883 RepID=UPI0036663FC3